MKTLASILGILILCTVTSKQAATAQNSGERSTDAHFCTSYLPDCFPMWLKPSSVGDKDLSEYGQKLETDLGNMIKQSPDWKATISNVMLVLLVGEDGSITDLFAYRSSNKEASDTVKTILSKVSKLEVPPKSLSGHRIALNVKYPKIKVYLDMNDPLKDQKHFEKEKSEAEHILTFPPFSGQ